MMMMTLNRKYVFYKAQKKIIWKGLKGLRKVLSVRGELETEQNYNILTLQLFWLQQHFFPILQGCSTKGLGAQPLLEHGSPSSIFSPTDLNFLSLGLYNNLTPTYFLRASHLYPIQPIDSQGYPLITWYLRLDAPVIYTGAFLLLTAWLGSIFYISKQVQIPISNAIIFTSRLIPLGKVWTPLSLYVRLQHYSK